MEDIRLDFTRFSGDFPSGKIKADFVLIFTNAGRWAPPGVELDKNTREKQKNLTIVPGVEQSLIR